MYKLDSNLFWLQIVLHILTTKESRDACLVPVFTASAVLLRPICCNMLCVKWSPTGGQKQLKIRKIISKSGRLREVVAKGGSTVVTFIDLTQQIHFYKCFSNFHQVSLQQQKHVPLWWISKSCLGRKVKLRCMHIYPETRNGNYWYSPIFTALCTIDITSNIALPLY